MGQWPKTGCGGLNHVATPPITLKGPQKRAPVLSHRRSPTPPDLRSVSRALALALLRGLLRLLQACHHLLPGLRQAAVGGQAVDQPRKHLRQLR